jgi:hypothetical protein
MEPNQVVSVPNQPDWIGLARKFWNDWRNSKAPDIQFAASWLSRYDAQRAKNVEPLCRCPEGICLMHSNSPGFEKKCSFKHPRVVALSRPAEPSPTEHKLVIGQGDYSCQCGAVMPGKDNWAYMNGLKWYVAHLESLLRPTAK